MTHTDLDYGENAGVQLVEERGKEERAAFLSESRTGT